MWSIKVFGVSAENATLNITQLERATQSKKKNGHCFMLHNLPSDRIFI